MCSRFVWCRLVLGQFNGSARRAAGLSRRDVTRDFL